MSSDAGLDAGDDSGSAGGSTSTADAVATDVEAATETFGLLSDETRVRILCALADAPEGLRFSELRSRVAVSDGGRFNYHLAKLRERLVEKSGETYVLTPAGADVAALL